MNTTPIKFAAMAFLIATMAWAIPTSAVATENIVKPADAIANVLAKDAALGAARNEATKTEPVANAIKNYVTALDAIDLQYCPEDFVSALHKHRDEWTNSIEFFEEFDEYRGELHEVFEMIRQSSESNRHRLDEVETVLFSSWDEVKAVAELN